MPSRWTSWPPLAKLRKEVQQLKARAGQVNTIVVPGETKTIVTEIETSPEEIIEELKLIRPTGDTRQQSMREVIHYMVSLTKAEAKAAKKAARKGAKKAAEKG